MSYIYPYAMTGHDPASFRTRAVVKEMRKALLGVKVPLVRREQDNFRKELFDALRDQLPGLDAEIIALFKRLKWLYGGHGGSAPFRAVMNRVDTQIHFWHSLHQRARISVRVPADQLGEGGTVYRLNKTMARVLTEWFKADVREEAFLCRETYRSEVSVHLPYRYHQGTTTGEYRLNAETLLPGLRADHLGVGGRYLITIPPDVVERGHYSVTTGADGPVLQARERSNAHASIMLKHFRNDPVLTREIKERIVHGGLFTVRTGKERGYHAELVLSISAGKAHKHDALYAERYKTFLERKAKVAEMEEEHRRLGQKAARKIALMNVLATEDAHRVVMVTEQRFRQAQEELWKLLSQAFKKKSLPGKPPLLPFKVDSDGDDRWLWDFDFKARYRESVWKERFKRANAQWRATYEELMSAHAHYRHITGKVFDSELGAVIGLPVMAALAA